MKLVAFGILAGLLFGAGCALETGDPGEPASTSTDPATGDTTPKVDQAAVSPQTAHSANPEPSPWLPGNPSVGMDEDSNGANPEPSPWHPHTPPSLGGTTGVQSGGASRSSGSAGGSTANQPGHPGTL